MLADKAEGHAQGEAHGQAGSTAAAALSSFEPFLTPFEGTSEAIRRALEPTLATLGLELIQLVFVRGSHKDTVRVSVDRPLGDAPRVSMADLERANRLISDVLDVEDQQQRLFPHAYDLEVGSPGVDRPLTKRSHFPHVRGERVKVKTRVAVANARSLTGTLVDADQEHMSLRLDGKAPDEAPVRVAYGDIQSAHTIYVFEAPQKPGHPKGGQAKPGQAKPGQAKPDHAKPGRASRGRSKAEKRPSPRRERPDR